MALLSRFLGAVPVRVWIAFAATVSCVPAVVAQAERSPGEKAWRVVVIDNADYLPPASAMMEQALRQTLTREAPQSVEFFDEALDSRAV